MIKIKSSNKIWNWYYIILYVACLISIYKLSFQVGTFSVAVMAFLMILKPSIFTRKIDWVDLVLGFYIVWCIASYIWSVGNNKFTNFAVSFGYTLMPCCFYFWAKRISQDESDLWIKYFMIATFWSMILGLTFYIWQPQFYREFLALKSYNPSSSLYNTRKWFSGIFGPTVIGSLCAIGATYELQNFFKGNKKSIVIFFLYTVLLVMSSRKSALVMYFLVSVYLIFANGIISRKNFQRIMGGLIFGIALIVFLWYRFPSIFNIFFDRFTTAEIMLGFSGRNSAILTSLSNVQSIVVGNGFGMAGHRAGVYNGAIATIYDNSYMLILCETGIVGLALFIGYIALIMNRAINNHEYCKKELIILVILLMQAFTSNIFELLYLTPLFWFCLGRCSVSNITRKSAEENLND